MDGDLIGTLITAVVAVAALITQGVQNARTLRWTREQAQRQLQQARDQAREQLQQARASHADTDRSARRSELWQRFEWACAEINSGDEARAAPGWALLQQLAADGSTDAADARMMAAVMATMREQQRRRRAARD
ncbi:hypothetical protein GCM10027586_02170 [Kineococcus gypseus]|uniref:hypothetical protein n=1 Tax=Kineococcus gypseus TaxID=1637102 RepID=UPI003D7C9AEF